VQGRYECKREETLISFQGMIRKSPKSFYLIDYIGSYLSGAK